MKKKTKATWFFDRNPAVDEYVNDTLGLFLGSFCIIGLYKARYARQYGMVVLNHAFGIWFE